MKKVPVKGIILLDIPIVPPYNTKSPKSDKLITGGLSMESTLASRLGRYNQLCRGYDDIYRQAALTPPTADWTFTRPMPSPRWTLSTPA